MQPSRKASLLTFYPHKLVNTWPHLFTYCLISVAYGFSSNTKASILLHKKYTWNETQISDSCHIKKLIKLKFSFIHRHCMSGINFQVATGFVHPNALLVLPLKSAEQARLLLEFCSFHSNRNESSVNCLTPKTNSGHKLCFNKIWSFCLKINNLHKDEGWMNKCNKGTSISEKHLWLKANWLNGMKLANI